MEKEGDKEEEEDGTIRPSDAKVMESDGTVERAVLANIDNVHGTPSDRDEPCVHRERRFVLLVCPLSHS